MQEGITGYSLCLQYKKEEIKDERECRGCYNADLARKKIGTLGRCLDALLEKGNEECGEWELVEGLEYEDILLLNVTLKSRQGYIF
jgi:hypothetical protein